MSDGDVVKRYAENPILTPDDIPFPCNTVFNAAAVKIDGEYILLLRVEDLTGRASSPWPAARTGTTSPSSPSRS